MRALLIFLITSTAVNHSLWGYDFVPEFKTVWDDHSTATFLKWQDSEYRSDHMAYQFPSEFDRAWLETGNSLQAGAGSLSGKEFLIKQRLRVTAPLTEAVDFRFYWFEERDWEEDARRFVWDFGIRHCRLGCDLRYSVFGGAQLYKEENDAGFAIEHSRPGEVDRLGVSFADYDRNSRSQGGATWDKAPVMVALTGHRKGPSYFLYYLRWEPSAILDDGAAGYDIRRAKNTLGFRGQLNVTEKDTVIRSYEYRFHLSEKKERNVSQDGSVNASSGYNENKLMMTFAGSPRLLNHDISFGVSGYLVEIESGGPVTEIADVLPFAWYRFKKVSRDTWSSQWEAGIEAGFHSINDQAGYLNKARDRIESRANLKYLMRFAEHGSFNLIFSFDVDRFGTSERWEGGAGQLSIAF